MQAVIAWFHNLPWSLSACTDAGGKKLAVKDVASAKRIGSALRDRLGKGSAVGLKSTTDRYGSKAVARGPALQVDPNPSRVPLGAPPGGSCPFQGEPSGLTRRSTSHVVPIDALHADASAFRTDNGDVENTSGALANLELKCRFAHG